MAFNLHRILPWLTSLDSLGLLPNYQGTENRNAAVDNRGDGLAHILRSVSGQGRRGNSIGLASRCIRLSRGCASRRRGGRHHCALIAETQATFGHPVTASEEVANNSKSCLWKSADGRVCGSVTVLEPGWNEVPDVKANCVAMTASLAAFGPTQDVVGIGEEAKAAALAKLCFTRKAE
jgi:hypothetical protein